MFVTEKWMFSVILTRMGDYDGAGGRWFTIWQHCACRSAGGGTWVRGAALSASTRRSYARDLAAFRTWCTARRATAIPAEPQTLAAYLADLAQTDRPATIGRKLAAIAVAHRDAGLESPTEHGMVKWTLAGIRREKGTAPHQKAALLVEDLR